MTAPAWVAPWIGRPFRLGGRGPDAYDCWGLVRAVLAERWGVGLPSYDACVPPTIEEVERIAAGFAAGAAEADWRQVVVRPQINGPLCRLKPEAAGDVLLLRVRGYPCHVGLVVASGWMLHIEDGLGSAAERYGTTRWERRVAGIFRHRAIEGCCG